MEPTVAITTPKPQETAQMLPPRSAAVGTPAGGRGEIGIPIAEIPRLEGYQISQRLGYGGMGTVWKAWQFSTRREVALKLLNFAGMNSEKSRRRFDREVEVTSRLQHPHIARVYDSGVHHGVYFYAMELIDGVPLDAYFDQQHLSRPKVLALMRTICRAVQHAHQRGVIHRDLKPSNILVDKEGQPHIVDFGLGKSLGDSDSESAARAAPTVSLEGEWAGTPAYMSPEQAAGKRDALDTRTDVYSLGVILYQLLAGRLPYDTTGGSAKLIQRVIEEDILRPRKAAPTINSELEALLLKALAKTPDARYPSAGALADDIDNYLRGEPLSARQPTAFYFVRKKLRKHRLPLAAVGAVLAILISAAVYASFRVARERDAAIAAAKIEQSLRRVAELRLADGLVAWGDGLISTDRWDEAKAKFWESHDIARRQQVNPIASDLGLATACVGSPPPLFQTSLLNEIPDYFFCAVAFSTDSRFVRWMDRGGAIHSFGLCLSTAEHVIPADAGPVRAALISDAANMAITVLASSEVNSASHHIELRALKDASPLRRIVLGLDWDPGSPIEISADGRFAALVMRKSQAEREWSPDVLAVADLAGDAPPRLLQPRKISGFCFLPDNTLVLSADGKMTLWNASTLEQTAEIDVVSKLEISSLTCSRDGRYVLAGGRSLMLIDVQERRVLRSFGNRMDVRGAAAISPDGTHALSGDSSGIVRLWDTTTGELLRTFEKHDDSVRTVCFSPDGKLAASTSNRDLKVWPLVAPLGQLLSRHDGYPSSLAISPDGRVAAIGLNSGLELIDLATGRRLRKFPFVGTVSVSFSPDGQTLFASNRWRGVVTQFDVATGAARFTYTEIVHRGNTVPRTFDPMTAFAPDGRYSMSLCIAGTRLWDLRTGALVRMLDDEPSRVGCFTSDGQLAMAVITNRGRRLKVFNLKDQSQFVIELDGYEAVRSVVPCSGNSLALLAQSTGTISAIDLVNRREVWTARGHIGEVNSLACSSDGRVFLSAGMDGSVPLWETETGREIRVVAKENSPAAAVAFSKDSRKVVAAFGGEKCMTRLWNLDEPLRIREGGKRMEVARNKLRDHPADPEAIRELVESYATLGVHDWAKELLQANTSAIGVPDGVPHVVAAQCFWRADDPSAAAREFDAAIKKQEVPEALGYLEICKNAAQAEGSLSAATGTQKGGP